VGDTQMTAREPCVIRRICDINMDFAQKIDAETWNYETHAFVGVQ
jgi:hypothetical protein